MKIEKRISQLLCVVLVSFVVLLVVALSNAFCDDVDFDKNNNYDIYLSGASGSTTIIKDVSILGIVNIEEKRFLLIDQRGFKLNRDIRGYVALNAITAILPHKKYMVRTE